jgi:hypothetical protein
VSELQRIRFVIASILPQQASFYERDRSSGPMIAQFNVSYCLQNDFIASVAHSVIPGFSVFFLSIFKAPVVREA